MAARSIFLLSISLIILFLVPHGTRGEGDPVAGEAIYRQLCAPCHGFRGDGGEGYRGGFTPHSRVLADKEYVKSLPDEYLIYVIQKGGVAVGKSNQMPAWEKRLDLEQTKDIIAHIRSLR